MDIHITSSGSSVLQNVTFWSALLAWLIAQFIKFTTHFARAREMDFRFFVSTGGMPSAHSSMVCALAASVGLREGFGGTMFAIALAFAIVVMFDAQSVRRASGQQARLLNQVVSELLKDHHLSTVKLREMLGHTRHEVFAGMTLGVLTALLVHSV